MKIIFTFILSLFCFVTFAQKQIPIDSVNSHNGQWVTVCGKVYGTKFLDKSQMTFINIGAPYPNSPLTIVIFEKARAYFPERPETLYANKQICVTGVIKEYKGKMQIVVDSPKEIVEE